MIEELYAWNQDFRIDTVICDDKSRWYSGSGWIIWSWIKGHLRCSGQENKGLEYRRVYPYRCWNHQ